MDLVGNGGFEAGGGGLAGWGTSDIDSPTGALGVQATGYAGVLFDVDAGVGGHAVHTGFGGGAGQGGTITLYQDLDVPASSDEGRLTFGWRAAYNLDGYADRTFDVQIQPLGGGAPVSTIRVHTATDVPGNFDDAPQTQDTGPQSASLDFDLTPYAGTGCRVAFVLTIPAEDEMQVGVEGEPGDAQLQLDDVHFYAAKGGVLVVGRTNSVDFPGDGNSTGGGGSTDVFISQYGREGTTSSFSGILGGKGEDEPADVAFSADGDIAVVGRTNSFDFPRVLPVSDGRQGAGDAFVAKITDGGTRVEFATYFGGGRLDEALGCAIDSASGDVYVVGRTNSLDFPRSGDALQTSLGDDEHYDGFVARFGTITNAFGVEQPGTLLYSSYLGGPDDDVLRAVGLSSTGSAVFVAGDTRSAADLPVLSALQSGLEGESDAFVAKLNGSGIFAAGQLVADARSPDTVALEWKTRPALATRLLVERTSGDGATTTVATLAPSATSYVDTGLDEDTTYAYSVVAVDPDGTQTPSNTAGTRTLPYPPAAPTGLVATAAGSKAVLTWNDASTNETGFDVQRLKGAEFTTVARVGADATRWETTLIASAALEARWRVVAVNRGGSSAPSNEAASTTRPTLSLKLRSGALADAKAQGADRFSASGTIAGAAAFDPNVQALRIEFGDPAEPVVVAVPAAVRGWTARRGVLRFSSAKSFLGGARFELALDVAKGTFTLHVAGFDFVKAPANAVSLGFAFGDEAGAATTTWTRRAAGRLILR